MVKYREVERALRQEIAAGLWRAGDRLPSEYDMARRFQVSYLTVRQAVSTLVDDGRLRRVRGKGTFIIDPASREAQAGARHPMALLLPSNWQNRDPYYFPDLLDGFQQAMQAAGCSAPLLSDNMVDSPGVLAPHAAVACLLIDPSHLQLVERLRDAGHRVVGVNRYSGPRSISNVRMDDAAGVEQAVDYLVSLGHRHISFLRGPDRNIDANERLAGFRTAAKRLGLYSTMEAGDDFGEASGYEATMMLLSMPNRPTALVCASDLAAIGAIRAIVDAGLNVPEDVSVIGFGDFSIAGYVRPSLTTVRQCRTTLGRTAGEMLIRLANDEEVTNQVLKAELLVRESTANVTYDP